MTRAERRHRAERQKRRVCTWTWCGCYWAQGDQRLIGKLAATPARCSCWMCGSQRRLQGPTRQERNYQRPSERWCRYEVHDRGHV